jgi:hypothetical protein
MVEAQSALDSKSESLLGVVRLYGALKLSKGIIFFCLFLEFVFRPTIASRLSRLGS